MKRTREERIALAARKKRAFRLKAPWAAARKSGMGLVIGSGGVGGSGVVRVPAGAPIAPEVKYVEGGFTSPTAGTAGQWVTLNNRLSANIQQGPGNGQRIGKNIRVVGIVYRMAVFYVSDGVTQPYTVDFIWDKKPTANTASISEIYDTAAAGGTNQAIALPNPNQETRFTWQKRIEKAASNSENSLVSGSFKCNKFVSYSDNSGNLGGQEQNDLIVVFGHAPLEANERAVIAGRIRLLYVDA